MRMLGTPDWLNACLRARSKQTTGLRRPPFSGSPSAGLTRKKPTGRTSNRSLFHEPWAPADSSSPTRIWRARLEAKYFAGYTPFDIDNVTARQFEIMDFARPLRGTAPCNLPRGLVFQDGRRLKQLSQLSALEGTEGCYWVDRTIT